MFSLTVNNWCLYRVVFLKTGSRGSAKGCQEFRATKMLKGGRVLLAVLNLYVRIKIRVATLGTNLSVTDCTQTINRRCSPEVSWVCSQVSQKSSPWTESMSQAK